MNDIQIKKLREGLARFGNNGPNVVDPSGVSVPVPMATMEALLHSLETARAGLRELKIRATDHPDALSSMTISNVVYRALGGEAGEDPKPPDPLEKAHAALREIRSRVLERTFMSSGFDALQVATIGTIVAEGLGED